MRAMQIQTLGQPMTMAKVDVPEPQTGQVRIRVLTCGMNFGDSLVVQGKYQEKFQLPFSPGMEICGIVDALGQGVDSLQIGQRIASYCGVGGLAEYTCIPADICVVVPENTVGPWGVWWCWSDGGGTG